MSKEEETTHMSLVFDMKCMIEMKQIEIQKAVEIVIEGVHR